MKIGVLGGGQLGRMLALAGARLGLRFRFYDNEPDVVAGQVGELRTGRWDDFAALDAFLAGLDCVTFEFENVPAATLAYIARRVAVLPGPRALETGQDRLLEKQLFGSLAIPTAEFLPVDGPADLDAALDAIGVPAVLKTRRLGYDGKGQFVLRSRAQAQAAWSRLGSAPLILERFVRFERELSILAVRSRRGETRFYPLVENEHREGMLHRTTAPAPRVSHALQQQAEADAARVLDALGYVGVLAIELFDLDGCLYANELAPRVHNSGHWTMDGAVTSQFENHLRAILGLPLGDPAPREAETIMINLVGSTPPLEALLGSPGAHVHLYGKSPRAGRKLGHVNFTGPQARSAAALLERML